VWRPRAPAGGRPRLAAVNEPSPYAAPIARVPVREDEVELRGGRTRFWVYGPDDAPHRVVLLHGLRGDHHGLEPIVAHLQGVRVVVPDLPGFGQSPPLPHDAHDVAGYRAWARDLLAAVAPAGDVVLAGHSFGSIVAAAALARPASAGPGPSASELVRTPRVRGLVLVNPIAASALAGPRVVVTRLTVLYHRLAAALPERAGTALLRHRVMTRMAGIAMATTRDPGLRRWIHAEHDRYFSTFADRRTLLEAFHASVRHDVGEFAADIAVPTLLVAAERDDIAPPVAQRTLVGRFADARLVMVSGTGHLAHYEAPAAVAAAMSAFLTALPVP
jgi:pimeloyl-ACP methyl ester carboxylesterase